MKKKVLYVTLVLLTVCSNVFAGRMWFYNEVEYSDGSPVFSGDTAIAMRSGNAWPVVACGEGRESGVACMLPGAWAKGPLSFSNLGPLNLDGATAPDNTVAFADNFGQVITLSKTGWGSGSYSNSQDINPAIKPSIAFNNNSVPGVLYKSTQGNLKLSMKSGSAWYSADVQNQDGQPYNSESFALDFDSYNQANVALREADRLRYGTKGVLTGNQWVFNSFENAPIIGNGLLDMALTNNDVPYVLYSENMGPSLLKYAVYDRQSDSWMTGILDMLRENNFCVAADSSGGIGVAYVADYQGLSMLSYAYNDGNGWTWLDRLVEAQPFRTVGLTFDYENNPVISFIGMDGRLKIAYDPVVIPEPATLAIITLGFVLIKRR